jgi:hypothetical protein
LTHHVDFLLAGILGYKEKAPIAFSYVEKDLVDPGDL